MENCCNITLSNTGKPGIACIESEAKKLLFVPRRTNAGVKNQINLTNVLNEAYFKDWRKEADKSARLYPLPIIENVEDVRAETIRQEFNSGYNPIVRKGTRSFTAMIVGVGAAYLAKLQGLACGPVDVYIVTKDSQLLGNGKESGFLNPIKIAEGTINFELIKRTPSELPMIAVTFDFDERENDADLAFLVPSQMDNFDLLDLDGLLGVHATAATSISTTAFTQYFHTKFGKALTGIPIQGLALADFGLAEVSPTPGAVSISTVAEIAPGQYTFTFSAQTPADVLRASIVADGFENESVPTVLIP